MSLTKRQLFCFTIEQYRMVFHDRFGINHVFSLCDGYANRSGKNERMPRRDALLHDKPASNQCISAKRVVWGVQRPNNKTCLLCDLYRVESRKTAYGRSRVFGERVEGFREKGRGFSGKDNFCPSLSRKGATSIL